MCTLKVLARDWLAPGLVRRICQIRGGGIRFEGDFATWEEASAKCTGYDDDHILAKVLDATLKVKHGEAAYERDSVLFDKIEYAWLILAGLMWAAARNGGKLNVLDFGGALGSSYFQNLKFLQTLLKVSWNVVEQPHYVQAGRNHIQDDQLHFYLTIEECLSENHPNVVLFSSVLQYLKTPFEIISQLSDVDADCLIVDRISFSEQTEDKLLVQRVPESIYSSSYPIHVFSQQEFLHRLKCDWRLIASDISPEGGVRSTSGFEFVFKGLLLERSK